jgi:hypothetical protein
MTVEAYYEENMILTAFGPDGVWRIYHQPGDGVEDEYFAVTVTRDTVTDETFRTTGTTTLDWLDAVWRVGVDIARQVDAEKYPVEPLSSGPG